MIIHRIGVDLIDMRHTPHNEEEWILHIFDQWSNIACPLRSKCTKAIADALHRHVFSVFGLPSIHHSNNGCEFVTNLIEEVASSWSGPVQLVRGRPRHPPSQRLVEQAHYTLERMITAKIVETREKHPPWTDWIPYIVCEYF